MTDHNRSAAAKRGWETRRRHIRERHAAQWKAFMEWGGPARVIREGRPRIHETMMKTNALYKHLVNK